MKRLFVALFVIILLLSYSLFFSKADSESSFLYKNYENYIAANDSLNAERIKNEIINKYPRSKETFDFASIEFFDKLYLVWTDDTLKVKVIKDLLIKYPKTNWRRTMYSYLAYYLRNAKKYDDLKNTMDEFRTNFSDDYLPYFTLAKYYYIDLKDTDKALDCAYTAFHNSINYPKIEYFAPMEWDLEKEARKYLREAILRKYL